MVSTTSWQNAADNAGVYVYDYTIGALDKLSSDIDSYSTGVHNINNGPSYLVVLCKLHNTMYWGLIYGTSDSRPMAFKYINGTHFLKLLL